MSLSLVVGLDAGGTKTAALGAVGDATVSQSGPGAHASRDGAEAASTQIAALVDDLRQQADAPLAALAVGLAGAGRVETRDAVQHALESRFPDVPVTVVHDGDIAYRAAWGDESGALLLVGTGAMVLMRTDTGASLRAGGWGPAIGDDGSGTALGRAALRVLLAALDGGPPSALPEMAAETLGLASAPDVIASVYEEKTPLASYATLLLSAVEAGDWQAEAALRTEVNALARQVGWAATRAGDGVRQRLRYAGGLSNESAYATALEAALERHVPGWDLGPCASAPVEGALDLARSLVASGEG